MTLPNFLVFGAGRSGTTSLHHYLGQHPEIFMPPVARYFELFERDQIRIYVFEEFRRDPFTVLRDIFNFLNVDEGFRPDTGTRHNPSGFIRNPVLRELWRSSATARQRIRPFLSMRVRHAASQWLHRHAYKPPFPPDLYQILKLSTHEGLCGHEAV
jgi:hypothetical protein